MTSNYAGSVTASCDASAISGQCLVTPTNPAAISANAPASLTVTLNVPNTVTPSIYNINLVVADATGQPSHTLLFSRTVIPDFSVTSATPSQTLTAGQTTSGAYQLTGCPEPAWSVQPADSGDARPNSAVGRHDNFYGAKNAGLYPRSERNSIFYALW